MVLGLSFWMMIWSGWRRAGSCIIKASGKADWARASHCDRAMCKSASVAPGLAQCCAQPTMKQAAAKSRRLFFVMVPASKREDGGETVEPMEAFLAPFAAPLPLDCMQADGPGRGPRAEGFAQRQLPTRPGVRETGNTAPRSEWAEPSQVGRQA
jgi:hypothetical protein